MNQRTFYSDFLFPEQNELTGFMTILDIFNAETPYSYSESNDEADIKAIAHDWASVGEDMRDVITKYGGETE
jgi:hypothetical protein